MFRARYNLRLNHDDTWHMDKPHFHEDVEILLSLSDGGDFFIEDELFPLRYGMLFLLPEATLHKSIADKTYRRYVMHVPMDMLESVSTPRSGIAAHIGGGRRCVHLEQAAMSEVIALLTQLEREPGAAFGDDIRQAVTFADFLLKVCTLTQGEETTGKSVKSGGFEQVRPIIEYLQQNLTRQLTLEGIAEHFYISKFHLCRIFKEATGFSVMEYIIHNRVLRARELLRTGARVQEAGEAVGFQSNAHFIRTFGALTGDSPKRYAKKYLDSEKS